MQRQDKEKWPEDFEPEFRKSRPGSRRNSASSSRKNSIKATPKKHEIQKSNSAHATPKKQRTEFQMSNSANTTPKKQRDKFQISNSANTTPKKQINEIQNSNSAHSTPKRTQPKGHPDLFVTGKQIIKKCHRANSLPTTQRRQSTDSNSSYNSGNVTKTKMSREVSKTNSTSSKSRETSLEDEMALDLSHISDNDAARGFCKFGIATSTPKICPRTYQKPRSGSLQSQKSAIMKQPKSIPSNVSLTRRSNATSRGSLYKTSSTCSGGRYTTTELEYSSVSPEYSTQSSDDVSPRTSMVNSDVAVISPYSQRSQLSGSSCYLSWVDSNAERSQLNETRRTEKGEWNNFWINYNNSISRVPIKHYYDQCPTPYRTEDINYDDFDLAEEGAPSNEEEVANVIKNEGLALTPRETQNIIKCAHVLGNVLSKAIDRKVNIVKINATNVKIAEKTQENNKTGGELKRNLKLELKEQNKPSESDFKMATTQTDISLPNTKSAPKIFENILRQLSRTTLDDSDDKKHGAVDDVGDDKT